MAQNGSELRTSQLIQSPKAEPFKMWLGQPGRDRPGVIDDPELGADSA
jgi:hypothetical protein